MLFNSLDFAVFLGVVFGTHWMLRNYRLQNAILLIASYVFYAWWDWRFLSLILVSTLVDFFVGLGFRKTEDVTRRKWLLALSVGVNLSLLAFFKYFNFFIDSAMKIASRTGVDLGWDTLNIILPVGISFYTFQTLSYSIDVYRKKLTPCTDVIAFATFVGFFPQLVAGPIEKAQHLLPQFLQKRSFDYTQAREGMRQMLWGLFKKMIIAEICATHANLIFDNSSIYSGSTLALGTIYFTIQIYCDFSGYSDIAIGTGKLFGVRLSKNFDFPFFSKSIAAFWRRWHISLYDWFKDYVYIPLGGGQRGLFRKVLHVILIFFLSGLWHGANFTYVTWGLLHALYVVPVVVLGDSLHKAFIGNTFLKKTINFLSALGTFMLVAFAFIIFRAKNLDHAEAIIKTTFTSSLFEPPIEGLWYGWPLVIGFFIVEWFNRKYEYGFAGFGKSWPRALRWSVYVAMAVALVLSSGTEEEFIYFQF